MTMQAPPEIARCPGCNATVAVRVRYSAFDEGVPVQTLATHPLCSASGEEVPADCVYADTPENRALLDERWARTTPCSACMRERAIDRGRCGGCAAADARNKRPQRRRRGSR